MMLGWVGSFNVYLNNVKTVSKSCVKKYKLLICRRVVNITLHILIGVSPATTTIHLQPTYQQISV